MKTGLLILPFVAIFTAALGAAAFSSLKSIIWLAYGLWAISAALLATWVALDWRGFERLFSRKGAKYGASSGMTVLIGLAIIVGLGFLSNKPRFNKSVDITRNAANTLSDQSIKLIDKLKASRQEIEITGFFDVDAQKDKFRDLLRLYEARGLPAKVSYVNPQTEPTKAIAQNVTTGSTVILKRGNHESRLTTFTEEKLTNSLLNVTKDKSKKVVFIKGHGESDTANSEAAGMSSAAALLKDNRFDTASLSLAEVTAIPDDTDLLVIAGPRYDFRDEELGLLDAYLQKGKPLFVMVDALTSVPKLGALMESYGIAFQPDILILRPDDPRAALLGQNNALVSDFDKFNPLTRDFATQSSVDLIMPNTRSVTEKADNKHAMKTTVVAKTAEPIIGIKNVHSPNDLRDIAADRVAQGPFGVFAVATGEVGRKDVATNGHGASDATKADSQSGLDKTTRELRIVAVGSSQFATNYGAQRKENMDMFLNVANYLLQDEDFIAIRPKDNLKSTLNMAGADSQFLLLFLCYVYPFLFLGVGIMSWTKRRRA